MPIPAPEVQPPFDAFVFCKPESLLALIHLMIFLNQQLLRAGYYLFFSVTTATINSPPTTWSYQATTPNTTMYFTPTTCSYQATNTTTSTTTTTTSTTQLQPGHTGGESLEKVEAGVPRQCAP